MMLVLQWVLHWYNLRPFVLLIFGNNSARSQGGGGCTNQIKIFGSNLGLLISGNDYTSMESQVPLQGRFNRKQPKVAAINTKIHGLISFSVFDSMAVRLVKKLV